MKKQTLCASCGHPATADTSTGNDGSLCATCESRIMKSLPPWRQNDGKQKKPFVVRKEGKHAKGSRRKAYEEWPCLNNKASSDYHKVAL